jgi:hypothetical protein
MLNELTPAATPGNYAGVDDVLACPDLPEQDVIIRRWRRNGASLRLRVRAFDLEQEARIRRESLIKHPVTQEVVEDRVRFVEASIREGVVVPKLTPAQAGLLRRKNPRIVEMLCDYLWLLSAFDEDELESMAGDLSGVALPTTEPADERTPEPPAHAPDDGDRTGD